MNAETDRRKKLPTAVRRAVWEAHGRRCAYTGDLIDWCELEIDHVIAVNGDEKRKADLRSSGVIGAEFDADGFENLLPTKAFRNAIKSNHIPNDVSIIYYLDLAAQKQEKVNYLYQCMTSSDSALKSYLQIKVLAEKNDINVDDMIKNLQYQSDGEVPLRVSLDIDGKSISSANSMYASTLMQKPFSLGGGSITDVILQNDDDEKVICRNANEFIAAKSAGFWPLTQFDINCFGLADETSELLRAVKESSYAEFSQIRTPHVNLKNLDKWASDWVVDAFIETSPDLAQLPTIDSLIKGGLLDVEEQSDWTLIVHSDYGFSVSLHELMRGDLDGDRWEEILVFNLTFAQEGTMRVGSVERAKIDNRGLLAPVRPPRG